MHIPRIGQEVVVEFLEGDPDRPIITGRVYNGDQHAALRAARQPDPERHQDPQLQGRRRDNFNELRFEDKKGTKNVYFHAEKDFNRVVENDDDLLVMNNQTDGDQEGPYGGSQRRQRKDTIKTGDRTEEIGVGNETLTSRWETEGRARKGNDDLTIKMGNQATKLSRQKFHRSHASRSSSR